MTKGGKVLMLGLLAFSLFPVWRSGIREDMNFWSWVGNHTIWGPPSEYVPAKWYIPK